MSLQLSDGIGRAWPDPGSPAASQPRLRLRELRPATCVRHRGTDVTFAVSGCPMSSDGIGNLRLFRTRNRIGRLDTRGGPDGAAGRPTGPGNHDLFASRNGARRAHAPTRRSCSVTRETTPRRADQVATPSGEPRDRDQALRARRLRATWPRSARSSARPPGMTARTRRRWATSSRPSTSSCATSSSTATATGPRVRSRCRWTRRPSGSSSGSSTRPRRGTRPSHPEPDLTLPLERRPLGGMGVHLARTLTDGMRHRILPGGGNEVTLEKRI